MKDAKIFFGHENNTRFFGILHFSAAQININISVIYCLGGVTGYF